MEYDDLLNYIMSSDGGNSNNITSPDVADDETGSRKKHRAKQINDEINTMSGGSLEYKLNEDETEYIVAGIGECCDVDIAIPEKHRSLPVTQIGENAFFGNRNVRKIYLHKGIKAIGERAFEGCTGLEYINLENVDEIGEHAFDGCDSIITESQGAYYVSDWVVGYGENITTALGILPNTIGIIDGALAGCKTINTVYLPKSLTKIGSSAFMDCENLEQIELHEGIEIINAMTFYGCHKLESITLPKSIKGIGIGAFFACFSLKKINIPKGTVIITDTAFAGCPSLEWIDLHHENSYFTKIDGALCTRDGEKLIAYPAGMKDEQFFVPTSVKTIATYAFSGSKHLKSVYIHNGVTDIGEKAFFACSEISVYAQANKMPHGWVQGWDEDVTNVYYGKSSWDVPSTADVSLQSDDEDLSQSSGKSDYGSYILEKKLNRRRFLPCRLIAFFGTVIMWIIAIFYPMGIREWAYFSVLDTMGFRNFIAWTGPVKLALVIAAIAAVIGFLAAINSDSAGSSEETLTRGAAGGLIAGGITFFVVRLILAFLGYIIYVLVSPLGIGIVAIGCTIALSILRKRIIYRRTKIRVSLRIITMLLTAALMIVFYVSQAGTIL